MTSVAASPVSMLAMAENPSVVVQLKRVSSPLQACQTARMSSPSTGEPSPQVASGLSR